MRYVVENVEEDIEQWCTLEYIDICKTVGKDKAIFTHIPEKHINDLREKLTARVEQCSVDKLEELNWDRVVLLDMDAEKELEVSDAANFDTVLVGGILGNVPSDDRTAELRKLRPRHSRHLGQQQMTTNTAVLVAKIILEDTVPLKDIPFVDEPEISPQENSKESICLPFRYVARSYTTKAPSDRNAPILPEGMLEFLLQSGDESVVV